MAGRVGEGWKGGEVCGGGVLEGWSGGGLELVSLMS